MRVANLKGEFSNLNGWYERTSSKKWVGGSNNSKELSRQFGSYWALIDKSSKKALMTSSQVCGSSCLPTDLLKKNLWKEFPVTTTFSFHLPEFPQCQSM